FRVRCFQPLSHLSQGASPSVRDWPSQAVSSLVAQGGRWTAAAGDCLIDRRRCPCLPKFPPPTGPRPAEPPPMTAPATQRRCRPHWEGAPRIVGKFCSSLLVDRMLRELNATWLASLAEDVAGLVAAGRQVILVSSG